MSGLTVLQAGGSRNKNEYKRTQSPPASATQRVRNCRLCGLPRGQRVRDECAVQTVRTVLTQRAAKLGDVRTTSNPKGVRHNNYQIPDRACSSSAAESDRLLCLLGWPLDAVLASCRCELCGLAGAQSPVGPGCSVIRGGGIYDDRRFRQLAGWVAGRRPVAQRASWQGGADLALTRCTGKEKPSTNAGFGGSMRQVAATTKC